MKILLILLILFTLFISSVCRGEALVISPDIQVNYPKPLLIANGGWLIFRYDNWYFSHEIVDPKCHVIISSYQNRI